MSRLNPHPDTVRSLRIEEPVLLSCQVCGKQLARPGQVWLVGLQHSFCPAHADARPDEPEIILPFPAVLRSDELEPAPPLAVTVAPEQAPASSA
jgi:hypothetical protein